eukprot:3955644-Pyramimonas_sp.AAC.1
MKWTRSRYNDGADRGVIVIVVVVSVMMLAVTTAASMVMTMTWMEARLESRGRVLALARQRIRCMLRHVSQVFVKARTR